MQQKTQAELDADLINSLIFGRAHNVTDALAAGASPNALNDSNTAGDHALHAAVRYKDSPAVKELILAGADVDIRSGSGATPLHVAGLSGHHTHIETLLRHGADVTLLTDTGNTPLHHTASSKSRESLSCLLRAGVDKNAVNRQGDGAEDVARKHNSSRFIGLHQTIEELGDSIIPAELPATLPNKAALLDVTADKSGLNPCNIGFWQQFEAIAQGLQAAGQPLSRADMHMPEQDGRTHLLDYASHFFAERHALQVMAKQGLVLEASDILGGDGQPRPYITAMAEAGTLGQLFTRELWQNASREAMQDCHRLLAEHFGQAEVRGQIRNFHQLLAAVPLEKTSVQHGR